MIELVRYVADNLEHIIRDNHWESQQVTDLGLCFHRLWCFWGGAGCRVWMHHHRGAASSTGMWHPHPWPMGVIVLGPGDYELGLGYGEVIEDLHGTPEEDKPPVMARVVAGPGFAYEMPVPKGWHYVRPLGECYTLMVSGPPWAKTGTIEYDPTSPLDADDIDRVRTIVASAFKERQ